MKWTVSSLRSDFKKIEWMAWPTLLVNGRFVLLTIVFAGIFLAMGDFLLRYAVHLLSWILKFVFG